ncbi:MAG: pirin family protein [Polyangiaceae bacterium]|nr:pirin family protein [Polyangiaceae bacterium]
MITVRRSIERRQETLGDHDVWHTFYPADQPGGHDAFADGFETLAMLTEDRIPPGGKGAECEYFDNEVVTYAKEGEIIFRGGRGRSVTMRAGEFQCLTVDDPLRHREENASGNDPAHLFRFCLHPADDGLKPHFEQKRFTTSERRGVLRIVASPDGRKGSLLLQQDALVYSSILDSGRHLVHELTKGRSAWIHIVAGKIDLDDLVLSEGDGAGVTGERALSFTAKEESEILVLDLGSSRSRFHMNGNSPSHKP